MDEYFQKGVNLSMDFYYYDLTFKNKGQWGHPKMVSYKPKKKNESISENIKTMVRQSLLSELKK
jgi:hypothetical protein